MENIASKESDTFLPISFDFRAPQGREAAAARGGYYGVRSTPSFYIDGTKAAGNMLEQAIEAALKPDASVSLTGSKRTRQQAVQVSGTVKNVSGEDDLSDLTVFVFAYEPGKNTKHSVNTVREIVGTTDISTLKAGATRKFSVTGKSGNLKIVVAVFDSSKKCLNAVKVD